MLGWSLTEAKQRCQVPEIGQFLRQGQLAGYGRVDGFEGTRVAIPSKAWDDMVFADEDSSALIHRPSNTELVDVLIYPILHAPDALVLLHDRGLGEVFMSTIVRDPEVAALGRRVMETDGYHHVFLEGNAPGPVLDPHWTLDCNAESLASRFTHSIMSFWEDPLPKPSAAIKAAAAALADRIAVFQDLLSTGSINAVGTYVSTGQVNPIHRAQWSRPGLAIDVASGDLCGPGKTWTPLWTGIILEHSKLQPAASLDLKFEQFINRKTSAKSTASSAATETHCRNWLAQLVRDNPAGAVKTKLHMFSEARQKWPTLSGRAF